MNDYVEYRRSSDQKFSSFVVEYEKRYRKVKRYKLDLPTGVQAFFLLQEANLAPDLEKLVRTTATLVYGDVKEKIQKLLIHSCGKDSGWRCHSLKFTQVKARKFTQVPKQCFSVVIIGLFLLDKFDGADFKYDNILLKCSIWQCFLKF